MGSDYVLLSDGTLISVDELAHSGIKGMKWGIRRYQNKDGSLTAAGRKRYNAEAEKLKEREKTIKNRERVKARLEKLDAKKADLDARQKALDDADGVKKHKFSLKKKDAEAEEAQKSAKDMSDEELFKALNRARMESEYNRLTGVPQPNNPQQGNGQQPGKSSGMMNDMVKPAVVNAGRNFLQNALTKIGEKALKDKEDPNSIEAMKKLAEKLEVQKRIELARDGSNVQDKFLSIEDRTKKYNLEKQKKKDAEEDWNDAIKRAKETTANEARSQINRNYMNNTSENKTSNNTASQSTSIINNKNISNGKSYADSVSNQTLSSSDSAINTGKSYFDWRGYDWDDD